MESTSLLMTLIRAGKRQEALELAERLKAATPLIPPGIKVDRPCTVTFYRDGQRLCRLPLNRENAPVPADLGT